VKRKLYLIVALAVTLVLSGGTYAYTYTTASGSMGVAEPTGNLAATAVAASQPDWNSLLPLGGNFVTEIMRPEAPGDSTAIPLQFPATGQHWDKVADGTPDDLATYVYSDSTSYKRDLYQLQDHAYGAGPIQAVTVYFRIAGIDPTNPSADARALIKVGSTVYTGNNVTRTGAGFATMSYQWLSNPATGLAWSWDDVDALQAGLDLRRGTSSSNYGASTQLYVEVSYQEAPIVEGDVPTGDLFVVTPHPDYTGDLQVKVYLTNTGALVKAYRYLNLKLYLPGSEEAGQTPDYQILNLENGTVTFNMLNPGGGSHTLSVVGGSYRVVSGNSAHWTAGWTLTPEFYIEVTQR
ncbi:MAG: hypothetical protein Q8O05_00030, partial [Chloroflexota bacterium]|nr:hypothetical protein [Chloroflexota bacterium]